MVGRGWWALVWILCAGWTVCLVCGGLACQPGQEFFSGRHGQCVPCTRCHDPLVVVVPCYVYQDAVCAPAAQFVPNWPRPGDPHLPITLSTTSAPHLTDAHVLGRKKADPPVEKETEERRKVLHKHKKNHGLKSVFPKNKINAQSETTFLAQNDSEKNSKKHLRHNRRNKFKEDLRTQSRSDNSQSEESKVQSTIVHETDGANSVEEILFSNDNNSEVLSGHTSVGNESTTNNGASNKDKTEESDLNEPDVTKWKETVFFAVITTISIFLVVLTIAILSHLQSILTQRKLKRVYDDLPFERVGETRVMEQLLPSAINRTATTVTTRGTVTYIRATTLTSTPSSPTITTTTTATTTVEAHPTSGHLYSVNPFTMDRLLEQRRVLGPASSVDTNLYIESWQQQDNQTTGNTGQCTPGLTRGSVSACPSPTPVRSYSQGPASASASPTVSVRRLDVPRGHVQSGLVSPITCVQPGGGS